MPNEIVRLAHHFIAQQDGPDSSEETGTCDPLQQFCHFGVGCLIHKRNWNSRRTADSQRAKIMARQYFARNFRRHVNKTVANATVALVG